MGFQVFPQPVDVPVDITSYGFTTDSVPATPTSVDQRGYAIYQINTSVSPGVFVSDATPSSTVGVLVFGSTAIANSAFAITPSTTATVTLSLGTAQTSYALWTKYGYISNNVNTGSGFSISTGRANNYKIVNNVLFLLKGNYNDVGESALAISTNGTSFTINRLGIGTSLVSWANTVWNKDNTYHVQTRSGDSFQSTDLINWTTTAVGFNTGAIFADAYYDTTLGLHLFVANSKNVWTSTDAVNWTTQAISFATAGTIYGIKKLNNLIFAVGNKNADRPLVAVSTDAVNWTDVNPNNDVAFWSTSTTPEVYDMEFINGRYVIPTSLTSVPKIVSSTDLINWTGITLSAGGNYRSTINDGEQLILIGTGSTANGVLWTTNGINFSTATIYGGAPNVFSTQIATQSVHLNFAAYSTTGLGTAGNKYFVLGGNNSTLKGTSSIQNYNSEMRYISYLSSNRVGSASTTFNMLVRRYNLSIDAR